MRSKSRAAAPMPPNERERLRDLEAYQLLDTREAAAYEAFAQLAREISTSIVSFSRRT